ncbi:MAG: FapA family protein [Deltaproteobacteria bacterium]|nr:FapA family protein [Deltaproteobacteria bacterium]
MLRTSVTISCDNPETARIEGAEKLGVQPDEVTVESINSDTFTVTMRNAHGQLNVVVLDHGMNATIQTITPPLGNGKPVGVKDIERALTDLNVVFGIHKDLIENIVSEVAATAIAQYNVLIAEGKPAKDGVDARIEFKFRLNGEDPQIVDESRRRSKLDPTIVIKEMVAEGDVLAVKIPSEEPVNGSTVTGETLSGAEPKDKVLLTGKNVMLLQDNVTYVVAEGVVAGYADYVDGSLCVEEALQISRDKLRVQLSVHPPSPSGKTLTMEIVEKMLADSGITFGIRKDAIEQAFKKATVGNMPILDTLIAEGMAPEPGEDARIELKFLAEKTVGTIDQKSGSIDYKERQALQNVKTGQVLAVKIPPTEGKNGISVYGDIIPADPGTDEILVPGENVEISDDGLALAAKIDGVAVLTQKNKVSVFKQFKVPGDVDYSTGNLSMDGTLDINGWIRTGFRVQAEGNINVGGGIEDACVEAGADISVKGGIIGSGEGKVHAGGNITVRFIENAQVHANGNILISNDIVRSNVSADGRIIDTGGKGRIRGGSVNAGKMIEMNEIGSPAGIVTHVSVGVASEFRERFVEISKKLAEFRKSKVRINVALSKYDNLGKDKTIPDALLRKLEMLREHRRNVVIEEEKILKERELLSKKLSISDDKPLAVKVKGIVYSGTTVFVNGYALKIKDDIEGKVIFILDEEELAVKMIR